MNSLVEHQKINWPLYLNQLTDPLLVQCYTMLFLISFILCFVIILSSGYGFSKRANLDQMAVQRAHTGFVPRVGGLAIYISALGVIPLLSFGFVPLSIMFDISFVEISSLILTSLPVFLIGLAEDLGYLMSVKIRLLASVVSSALAMIILEVWIFELGIPMFDLLLMFTPFAILFTLFSTVGVVNAFNLIDGLNGLSGLVTISIAIALSLIAFQIGNNQILILLFLIVASVLGFLVLNFPMGKIFLGDGGAYFLGHLLVWCSLILVSEETNLSPFAILLIFFWPVADTGLAIWRRWKLGNPTGRPDRLHFHQLAMRFLEICFLGRARRNISNPIATLILLPLFCVPQFLGILFWNNYDATVWCTLFLSVLFIFTYFLGIFISKRGRTLSR